MRLTFLTLSVTRPVTLTSFKLGMLANNDERSVKLSLLIVKLLTLKLIEVAPELPKALTYALKKSAVTFFAPARFTFFKLSLLAYKNVLVSSAGKVTLLKSRSVKAESPLNQALAP